MKRTNSESIIFRYLEVVLVMGAVVLLALTGCSTSGGMNDKSDQTSGMSGHEKSLPPVGLAAYTIHHARMPFPPERIGGAVTITATQEEGSTRWVLPGPRNLDPAVFGTPDHPLGWEKNPFPWVGIPLSMRQQKDGKYTIVDHATPFGDWMESGVGSLRMKVTDLTAIDGITTQDKVEFEATFQSPDKTHDYRVVAKIPLPHGKFSPTFGGVVTDHLLHGVTGIGSRLMPSQYAYVSFWAKGQVYVDGKLTNDDQLVHVMIGEFVRGDNAELQSDGGVGGGGTGGKTLHLMVPPYRIGPKGPEKAPVRSDYIPFPAIEKRMMADKAKIMQLPPAERKEKMAKLMATKKLMMKTKNHMWHMMAKGEMFGQPFFHIMYGHVQIDRE